MAVFKTLYRGRGIYWHGKRGYGDETTPVADTLAGAKAVIDRNALKAEAVRVASLPPEDRHWESLPIETRRALRDRYRGEIADRFYSVASYAWSLREG